MAAQKFYTTETTANFITGDGIQFYDVFIDDVKVEAYCLAASEGGGWVVTYLLDENNQVILGEDGNPQLLVKSGIVTIVEKPIE
jgi:hypothetical protein